MTSPVPAASRGCVAQLRPRRKRHRFVWGCGMLAVLLVAGGISFPWLYYGISKARLEREAGPLSIERFLPPKVPLDNPGSRLLEAGRLTRVAKEEGPFLNRLAKSAPSEIRAHRAQLEAVLKRNAEALARIQSLG